LTGRQKADTLHVSAFSVPIYGTVRAEKELKEPTESNYMTSKKAETIHEKRSLINSLKHNNKIPKAVLDAFGVDDIADCSLLTMTECNTILASCDDAYKPEAPVSLGPLTLAQAKKMIADETSKSSDMHFAALFKRQNELAHEVHEKVVLALENIVQPSPTVVQIGDSPKTLDMGIQHYKFPLLLKVAGEARIVTMLVGPAGGGKTTAGEKLAEAFGLPFYMSSVGEETSKSDLIGYMTGSGDYCPTFLRTAYEHGGVYLMDEVDAANANVLTIINALLANNIMGFPDKMVKKHKDFIFVAGGNTYGTGSNRMYVGRNQLDAATLDRFAFIEWPIDEALEASFLGISIAQKELPLDFGGIPEPQEILNHVRHYRANAEEMQIRHLVSPRATIHGYKLSLVGIGWEHIKDLVVWKGCSEETKEQLEGDKENRKNSAPSTQISAFLSRGKQP